MDEKSLITRKMNNLLKQTAESKITTYLFDLDGTLIDEKIYSQIYVQIIAMLKKRLGLTEIEINQKAELGKLKKNKAGRWDTGELCQLLNCLEEYYHLLKSEISEKIKTIHNKEITALLTEAKKAGKQVGIVSNSFRRTINLYLTALKIEKQVDFIFSPEEAGGKKSELKFWKKLLEVRQLNPTECLVIGNDPVDDLEMPQKLGFKSKIVKVGIIQN